MHEAVHGVVKDWFVGVAWVSARSVVQEMVQVLKTKLDFGTSRNSKASISFVITYSTGAISRYLAKLILYCTNGRGKGGVGNALSRGSDSKRC